MNGDGDGDADQLAETVEGASDVDGGDALDGQDADRAQWHPSPDICEKLRVFHRCLYREWDGSQRESDGHGDGQRARDVGRVSHVIFLGGVGGGRRGW